MCFFAMSFKEYYKCYFLVIKEDMKNKEKKNYIQSISTYTLKLITQKKGKKHIL